MENLCGLLPAFYLEGITASLVCIYVVLPFLCFIPNAREWELTGLWPCNIFGFNRLSSGIISLRCRITQASYAGKENREDSWTDIISTHYLGLLNKTTLLEAGITFPTAWRPWYRYIAPLAWHQGKIHCHHVCSPEQYSLTQIWARFSSLNTKVLFFPLPTPLPFLHQDIGVWWQCFTQMRILREDFSLFQSWKVQTWKRSNIPTFAWQLILLNP